MKITLPKSIVSQVLAPALKLWLRTQVEEIKGLQISISGSNRQILEGYIPRVSLTCDHAIYQGLQLNKTELEGENIRINIGQVIKGKSLELLEPVLVKGEASLREQDLQASLSANLLSTALKDLLLAFISTNQKQSKRNLWNDKQINWDEIKIDAGKLTLTGSIRGVKAREMPISLRSGLNLVSPHELSLSPIFIEAPELGGISIHNYKIDLGQQVYLEKLNIAPGKIFCRGSLTVVVS